MGDTRAGIDIPVLGSVYFLYCYFSILKSCKKILKMIIIIQKKKKGKKKKKPIKFPTLCRATLAAVSSGGMLQYGIYVNYFNTLLPH